jgi:nucleoside-diphosphate-sugar epimerase
MHEAAPNPLAEFRRVNVNATLMLAREAAAAGVRRFIYVSSIKVNGEVSAPRHPFTADDSVAPQEAYSVSKHEAELGLQTVARKTGMEVVIIRPPLVYGPGVRANFLTMLRWVDRGWPLPFGSIQNQRSLVAADNLSDLLARCLFHPAAGNQVFLISDGEDLSTPELLRRLGRILGKPARLIPVPPRWLIAGGTLIGRRAEFRRLSESLQVDALKTARLLAWKPPVTVDEALRRTVANYRESRR